MAITVSLIFSGCGSGKEVSLENLRKEVQSLQEELKARDAELQEVKARLSAESSLTVDERIRQLRQELAEVKEESAAKIKKVRKHLSIAQKDCDEKDKRIVALSNELKERSKK